MRVFTGSASRLDRSQQPAGHIARRVRERRQPSPRPRPQGSGAGDGHTDPRVITSRANQADTALQVLKVIWAERENPELNLISVSAAWKRLAELERSITKDVTQHPSLLSFVNLTEVLLQTPTSRSAANMFWATTRLQGCMPLQLRSLHASLERAVLNTADKMNTQEIANVIWAVEKRHAQGTDATGVLRLLPVLAKRVPFVISEMNSQAVANIIWAGVKLATTGAACEVFLSLLPIVTDRIPAVIPEMTAQHVANVIWATGQLAADPHHSKLSQQLYDLLPDLVVQAREVLPSARPQALANSCWGLALSNHYAAGFLDDVANKVANEAREWKPKGAELDLPQLLCAFARLQATGHDDMLDVAAEKLEAMLPSMNDWGLCALTWSYSKLDLHDDFFSFRQRLQAEVARRGFSDLDVEGSRLGPEAWRKHPDRSI